MSFEVFWHNYERGEPSAIPLSDVLAAFQAAIVHSEVGDGRFELQLEYPVLNAPEHPHVMEFNGRNYPVEARDCSEVYGRLAAGDGLPPAICGFMIADPAADLSGILCAGVAVRS